MTIFDDVVFILLAGLTDFYAVDGLAGEDQLVINAAAISEDITAEPNAGYTVTSGTTTVVTAQNFEKFKIISGSGNDTLMGANLDDHFEGGAGNDDFFGDNGSDTLLGGSGDDTFTLGGPVNDYFPDVINGGAGHDRLLKLHRNNLTEDQTLDINFLNANGASFSLTDGTTVEQIEVVTNFTLGSGDDEVKITLADNDDIHSINSYDGVDFLTINASHFTGRIITNMRSAELFTLHRENTPWQQSLIQARFFEAFWIIAGSANDNLKGGPGNDRLEGNGGVDYIEGEDGNDTLLGGDGDDLLIGGAGNDRLFGGAGADTLIGGDGIDTVNYLNSPSGVTISLTTNNQNGGHATNDQYNSIESLDGSKHDDHITGNLNNNLLRGNAGDDVIIGLDGNDALGGADGDDTLQAGNGHDRLYGNDGNDILDGGAGNDRSWGGNDEDTFIFKPGYGTDKIMDFELNSGDIIDVSDFNITNFTALENLMVQNGNDIRITFPTGEILIILNTSEIDFNFYHFTF